MAGFTPLMFGHRWCEMMVRAIRRSIFYSDFDDTDILEWLEDHQSVRRITDLPDNHAAPCLLHARLLSHVHTEVCITLPSQQQIDFETPSQVLGVEGLLVAASIIFIVADRIRTISLPAPNFYNPDRFAQIQVEDSIPLAFRLQRMVVGRMNGATLSGSSFLLKCASNFGVTPHFSRSFPDADEMILLSSGRTHIHQSAAIPDLRRFRTHLESLAGFVATFQVVFQGLGFRIECSLQDAILAVTELFLGANRIPAYVQEWAVLDHCSGGFTPPGEKGLSYRENPSGWWPPFTLPVDSVTDHFDRRSSIPSWMNGLSEPDECDSVWYSPK